MNYYYTIEKQIESDFIINRSHFITSAVPVDSMAEAREFIEKINKKYNDATHNCYAFISDNLGLEQRFSDDGEPQGTAGQPMLEVLKKQNLKCVVVVVTRYFGGIKLGAGGLVSAYTRGVTECLQKVKIVKYVKSNIYKIKIQYTYLSAIEKAIEKFNANTENIDYGNDVTITVSINLDKDEAFIGLIQNVTSGKAEYNLIEKRYAIEK